MFKKSIVLVIEGNDPVAQAAAIRAMEAVRENGLLCRNYYGTNNELYDLEKILPKNGKNPSPQESGKSSCLTGHSAQCPGRVAASDGNAAPLYSPVENCPFVRRFKESK
jgi:hypothetical protein